MSNAIAKQNHSEYLTRYETPNANPYAAFAAEGGPGIRGKLLACRKGEWGVGQDANPVPAGATFLLVVDEIMRGWLKWQGGAVVSADMGYVRDGFKVRHRFALGDNDENEWEKNPDGLRATRGQGATAPCSSRWRRRMAKRPLADRAGAASWRSRKSVCAIRQSLDLHPDSFPVVTLTTKTWPNKSYGPIKGPWFEIVGWATVEDVKAGRKHGIAKSAVNVPKKLQAKAKASAPKPAEETPFDDPMPDWDKIGS